MIELLGYTVIGITQGMVYALIALSFVLVYKCTGVFNLALGELVIFSAYLFFFLAVTLGVPIGWAIIALLITGGILGLVIARAAMQPLVGQSVLALVMATLALGAVLQGVMRVGWGAQWLVLPRLFPTGGISVAGISVAYDYFGFLIIPAVLLIAFTIFFRRSRIGLSMMAISEDQQGAQSLGISVNQVMMVTWIIAVILCCVGGILLTNITGANYGQVSIGLKALAVALIGGLESIPGVIVGGLLVGIIECVTAGYINPLVGGGFQEVAAFIMLILVLIIRPYGFFGWKRIERV